MFHRHETRIVNREGERALLGILRPSRRNYIAVEALRSDHRAHAHSNICTPVETLAARI